MFLDPGGSARRPARCARTGGRGARSCPGFPNPFNVLGALLTRRPHAGEEAVCLGLVPLPSNQIVGGLRGGVVLEGEDPGGSPGSQVLAAEGKLDGSSGVVLSEDGGRI